MEKGIPNDEHRLAERYRKARVRIAEEMLPGCKEWLAGKGAAAESWLRSQEERVDRAVRDDDVILFERALAGLEKGWAKVNIGLAETYRGSELSPEMWELRYVKWMRIQYIKFKCSMGEFYILPRAPSRRPKAKHWWTVDEMLDVLGSNATTSAIALFGQLPVRPDSIEGPAKGEKHLVMNFVEDGEPEIYYKFGKGWRNG